MDHPSHKQPVFADILKEREFSRRSFLKLGGMLGAALSTTSLFSTARAAETPAVATSTLTFREIAKNNLDRPVIAAGYKAEILLRWGDDLNSGNGPFNPRLLSPEDQARRFGYNNDYIAYMPLPRGSDNSEHGILHVNHEYTNLRLMFPGMTLDNEQLLAREDQGRIEQQAQGFSVVEVKKHGNTWEVVGKSDYNRRVTATTPMEITGPAAGSKRMQTEEDPTGKKVKGTFGNCSGGVTPWGTVLTCEENFDEYFGGIAKESDTETKPLRRYGVDGGGYYNWYKFDPRFNLGKNTREANRFGWVVEYDPYDPKSVPKKRTALGRFKHECATCVLTADGRLAVYSGDDEVFEYVYRFVTKEKVDVNNPKANSDLLDEGTLSVARFQPDGVVKWLPLVYGEGPITDQNGFHSQADVVIEARRAADLLDATPMDRPEDVETNPHNHKVYVVMTKNAERPVGKINAANRRAPNRYGHILEMVPPMKDGKPDHGAEHFEWDTFLLGGDPAKKEDQARYLNAVSDQGWLACPDNVAFDAKGRIWIATDGQYEAIGKNEGLYAADTEGAGRGSTRLFFTSPVGAEITGPYFTPDGKTLFLSIQHPGEDPDGSTYDRPSTRWPDFSSDMPPRPSVLAITKEDDGIIGG